MKAFFFLILKWNGLSHKAQILENMKKKYDENKNILWGKNRET